VTDLFSQIGQIVKIISFVGKNRLAVMAALNEMVRVVGDDDASSSEHARKVAREGGTEALNHYALKVHRFGSGLKVPSRV